MPIKNDKLYLRCQLLPDNTYYRNIYHLPDTITATQIEGSSFLKYINIVVLKTRANLDFYNNLVVQTTWYNMFLCPEFEITPTNRVIPNFMSSDCESITATILYFKICQKSTITDSYMNAHNLLVTPTNGFELLQLLH